MKQRACPVSDARARTSLAAAFEKSRSVGARSLYHGRVAGARAHLGEDVSNPCTVRPRAARASSRGGAVHFEERRVPRAAMAKRSCDGGTIVTMASDDKRARTENGGLVPAGGAGGGAVVTAGPARTSDLLAPIMLLTGHAAPVLSSKFSPDGQHVLSGSHDKLMLLWETFGECANTLTFRGHSNAVLEVQWAADGESVFSASADKTAAVWDAQTGGRTRQFKGHTQIVNSFCPARDANTCASASDDATCKIWDTRVRVCQHTIAHPWAVTSVSMSHGGTHVYTGCLDGVVRAYDLRRPETPQLELEGHQVRPPPHATHRRHSPKPPSSLSRACLAGLCLPPAALAGGIRAMSRWLAARMACSRAPRHRRCAPSDCLYAVTHRMCAWPEFS